jgi:hypothetical protein
MIYFGIILVVSGALLFAKFGTFDRMYLILLSVAFVISGLILVIAGIYSDSKM